MKNILIPTDFSDNAWDALLYALRIYDDIPCCFHLLNTFEVKPITSSYPFSGDYSTLINSLKENSEKELDKLYNHIKNHCLNDKHIYKTRAEFGTLVNVIHVIVKSEHIDLVVMGTEGASGFKEAFIGSHTMDAIKHIEGCPILAVPNNYEFEEPKTITFATDLEKLFRTKELECIIELELIHNLKLEILHIKHQEELSRMQIENIAILKQHFGTQNVTFKEVDLIKSKANTINNYTSNNKVDIICLAKYQHSFLEKLRREPVLKKVSFHTEIPLLIIPKL